MADIKVAARRMLRAVKRLRPHVLSRRATALLGDLTGLQRFARGSLPRSASFLWPAGCFRHREALAPLIAAGDSGLLGAETVAGKRILCLVETDADVTIVHRLFQGAARVDFVLQQEHQTLDDLIANKLSDASKYRVQIFDNISTIGNETEVECSHRNFEFFRCLTKYFESIFDSDPRIAKYRPFSAALAGYIEPRTYAWCFLAPMILERLMSACTPDVIILLCQSGRYFAPLLAKLRHAAGETPLLIGYSHHLPSQRCQMAERIAEIADCEWLWLKGPRRRSIAADIADRPGDEIAAALEKLEAATEEALRRFWPELTRRRHYGAIATIQANSVSYNYRFRRQLLERLARNFDLNLFLLDAEPATQQTILDELRMAARAHGRDTRLAPYASSNRGIHDALAVFLDRRRAAWQCELVDLAGGDWVLPIFEVSIFDWMVDLIAAGLEYVSFLQPLFRSYPPAFALAITGQTPSAEILLTAARQASVPTFDMQVVAIYDHPHTRTTLLPKADHFFALDVQSAELLADWGWPPERLYVNGSARFDQLLDLDAASHRQRGRAVFAGREYKQIVVFISQVFSLESCQRVLSAVALAIAIRPDTGLIVKLHPQEPRSNGRIYETMLADSAPARNWRVIGDIDIDDVLCASDLVIGLYSSALLEAACLHKPVIAANLTGKRFLEPINFGDRDCILGATSENEVATLIASILDDESFRMSILARQAEYFRRHSYAADGGAMERVAQCIEDVVEGRAPSASSLATWRLTPTSQRAPA